ncbi:hypothetical protein M0R45_002881 [Rubus argutus]|uniref:MHC class I antigen n=1 Tax=Rubus argutus TaxID=59490 RepID=A0AAW1YEL2_RUBAR
MDLTATIEEHGSAGCGTIMAGHGGEFWACCRSVMADWDDARTGHDGNLRGATPAELGREQGLRFGFWASTAVAGIADGGLWHGQGNTTLAAWCKHEGGAVQM